MNTHKSHFSPANLCTISHMRTDTDSLLHAPTHTHKQTHTHTHQFLRSFCIIFIYSHGGTLIGWEGEREGGRGSGRGRIEIGCIEKRLTAGRIWGWECVCVCLCVCVCVRVWVGACKRESVCVKLCINLQVKNVICVYTYGKGAN